MSCAVNVAMNNKLIETTSYRDLMGLSEGMSCLYSFEEFHTRDLVLWELKAVVCNYNEGTFSFS